VRFSASAETCLPFTVIETVVVAIEASIIHREHDVPDCFNRCLARRLNAVRHFRTINPRFSVNLNLAQ
jgi:hypothetical protein